MAAPITPSAADWKDEVELVYDLFNISPNVTCTDTIARHTGKWRVKHIWVEWAKPSFVADEIKKLVDEGWLVETFAGMTKPQEEIDLANTTIVARKRSAS